jgi:hypothetical protein
MHCAAVYLDAAGSISSARAIERAAATKLNRLNAGMMLLLSRIGV